MPDVRELTGGRKQLWINQNRQLIIDYCREFGEAETCEKFNLKKDTLTRIIQREGERYRNDALIDVERAHMLAQINDAGIRELKHEIKDLKREYSKFTESVSVQLVEKFFNPLLQRVIVLPEDMNPVRDQLALTDFYRPRKGIETKKDDD